MTKFAELFDLSSIAVPIDTLDLQTFSTAARSNLLRLNKRLQDIRPSRKVDEPVLVRDLEEWSSDPQHGIGHSFDVFRRMIEIRDRENLPVDDGDLFLRAISHDLAPFLSFQREFMPVSQDELSLKHPKYMKYLISLLGRAFNLEDARQLATDIYHHDDFYLRPSRDEMDRLSQIVSPAGQILADADKLSLDVKDAITRNRVGSLGRWYILRSELGDERQLWQPRTGGLFDGFSALALEFLSPEWRMYLNYSRQLYRERASHFEEELYYFYGKAFEQGWRLLALAQQESWQIKFGLRDRTDTLEIPINQREAIGFDQQNFEDQIKLLLQIPVISKSDQTRFYYGYSVKVTDIFGNENWLDPSMLTFPNTDELVQAFRQAIQSFTPTQL